LDKLLIADIIDRRFHQVKDELLLEVTSGFDVRSDNQSEALRIINDSMAVRINRVSNEVAASTQKARQTCKFLEARIDTVEASLDSKCDSDLFVSSNSSRQAQLLDVRSEQEHQSSKIDKMERCLGLKIDQDDFVKLALQLEELQLMVNVAHDEPVAKETRNLDSLCDCQISFEAEFAARLNSIHADVRKQQEQTVERIERLESSLQNMDSRTASRINAANDFAHRHEDQMAQRVTSVEASMRALEDQFVDRVNDAETALHKQKEHSSRRITIMQASLNSLVDQVSLRVNVVEANQFHQKREQQVSTQMVKLQSTVLSANDRGVERLSELGRTLRKELATTNQRIDNLDAATRTKLVEMTDMLTAADVTTRTHHNEVIARIQTNEDALRQQQEQSREVGSSDARHELFLSQRRLANNERSIAALQDQLAEELAKSRTTRNQILELSATMKVIEVTVEKVEIHINDRLAVMESQAQSKRAHVVSIHDIEERCKLSQRTCERLIEQLGECMRIDLRHTSQRAAQDESKRVKTQLSTSIAELTSQIQRLDDRISTIAQTHKVATAEIHSAVEEIRADRDQHLEQTTEESTAGKLQDARIAATRAQAARAKSRSKELKDVAAAKKKR
jgi:hypothetical protein